MEEYEKTCDNCRFEWIETEDYPCHSCTRNKAKSFCDQWEEKEEEVDNA